MALTECPDCGCSVSTEAPACPKCGRPLHAVVIEQSAKRYKGAIALSVCIAIGGFIAAGMSDDATFGIAIFFAGIAMLIVAMLARWWQHG